MKKALLERVPLHGICRIFDVSVPWSPELIDGLIEEIPQDLNAEVMQENDEIEAVMLQTDELWSYVGAKTDPHGCGSSYTRERAKWLQWRSGPVIKRPQRDYSTNSQNR